MILIGIVVMVAGMFIQQNHLLAAIDERVTKMGIPLELGMTIATIGVFLILFKVIESFFFNPLRQAIDHDAKGDVADHARHCRDSITTAKCAVSPAKTLSPRPGRIRRCARLRQVCSMATEPIAARRNVRMNPRESA